MSSDSRNYDQSTVELSDELGTLARVFESPAKYYLAAALGILSESFSYSPEEDELTITGNRTDVSQFTTGKVSGFIGGILSMLPVMLFGILLPVTATHSSATVAPLIALLVGFGLSLGALRTATGWTIVDESVERPETTEVVEQYVNGDLQDERELEEKLEASLK